MTKTIKFDEADRSAVIRAIQAQRGVRLSPVRRRRKWLRDEENRSYWVLGGYDEWHGIPEEMMDAEADEPTGGFLALAIRKREALQIFFGPVEPIVRNRSRLYRARQTTGEYQYQFTITTRGNRVHIKQVPGAALRELAEVVYPAREKAKDQNAQTTRRLLESLSPEDQRRMLQELTKST
jgi:hypothetical protein